MNKKILNIAMMASILIVSCKEESKQTNSKIQTMEQTSTTSEDLIKISKVDADDNSLDMTFDNVRGVATIKFNGDTAQLTSQKPASGIWYKNDVYELRGKGNDLTLTKNGKVVFEHKDLKTSVTSKNENGDVLTLSFNITEGTAKAYLNGGDQIDLVAQKAASGFWYSNDQYELRGQGNDLQLTKDDVVVFEHKDQKVVIEAKGSNGDILNMTFNNTDGTLQAFLNGGDQIDLVAQKAASGIWYKNDYYELRGKGDSYELTKDGKTVFKN